MCVSLKGQAWRSLCGETLLNAIFSLKSGMAVLAAWRHGGLYYVPLCQSPTCLWAWCLVTHHELSLFSLLMVMWRPSPLPLFDILKI